MIQTQLKVADSSLRFPIIMLSAPYLEQWLLRIICSALCVNAVQGIMIVAGSIVHSVFITLDLAPELDISEVPKTVRTIHFEDSMFQVFF